jgi:hypothetical protein
MRITALAVCLVIALAGCVSETSVFRNPDGTQTAVCSGAGFGIIRGTIAIAQYHNCREAYLSAGYKEQAVK